MLNKPPASNKRRPRVSAYLKYVPTRKVKKFNKHRGRLSNKTVCFKIQMKSNVY